MKSLSCKAFSHFCDRTWLVIKREQLRRNKNIRYKLIKIKKNITTHPWSLGFLALISGKVELKRVANPNSLVYKRLEKSENFQRQKKIFEEIAVSVMNK